MSKEQSDAEKTISENDKAKRLSEEAEILAKASALTNGSAGNPKLIGEVMHWQVTETIAQGKLLRIIVETQSRFQLKEDCIGLHKPKTWAVKIFGTSYQVPTTTFIIVVGFLFWSWLRSGGHI